VPHLPNESITIGSREADDLDEHHPASRFRRRRRCHGRAGLFAASGCGNARITVNGMQNKTGAQVAQDAAGAIGNARSVHVEGVIFSPR